MKGVMDMGTLGQAKYIGSKYGKRSPYEPRKYKRIEFSGLVYRHRKYESPIYEKRLYKSRKYHPPAGRKVVSEETAVAGE